jgi:predicted alpha/beta hydrolase family esterase
MSGADLFRSGRRQRVMIVPGLHGSGPVHWQSWMESELPGAVRVPQEDWDDPRIAPRAQAIADTLDSDPDADWIVVAHSLGCLAVAHYVQHTARQTPRRARLRGALLVTPASPTRFNTRLEDSTRLPFLAQTVASRNDPWLPLEEAFELSQRWGSRLIDAGPVGHLNVEAGFGPWPYGLTLLRRMQRELHAADCAYLDD